MLTKINLCWCVAPLLICGVSLSVQAKDPEPGEAAFDAKFAQDVRDVRRTRSTGDDAEFAQRLLKEAQSGEHADDLTAYICVQAYEFGLRDKRGYPAANDALDKLLEKDASRKFDVAEMRVALYEQWQEEDPEGRGAPDYEAFIDTSLVLSREALESGDAVGALKLLNRVNRFASKIESPRQDDVRDTITDLIRTRKTLEEIAELEEAMGTDPAAADKLAMIYLGELDDPAKAATYADKISDPALAANIRLAAKEFAKATPEEASQAGAFYFDVVTEKKTGDSVAMLIRARVWLTEYLSREPGKDQAATIKLANETLGEIDGQLLRLGIGTKLQRKMSSRVRGEGQFDRPAEIQAAVDKGVEWLYKQHNKDTHWEKDTNPNNRHYGGYTALVVYALLMADEDPRINGDLSRATHFMMNVDMKGTYALCFRIHAWEVMPRRERYRQILNSDVHSLRQAGTRHGFWGYTLTGNDVKPGSRLDLSTTLAGGLGLWIGEEVGGVTPKAIYWERTARALIDCQHEDNGWSYNPATMTAGQGAMTAGALALLHASYPHLGEVTKAAADEAIAKGIKWMDENFSPTTNVNRGGFKNYYFAAVQHAGLFAGRRNFREMDWYESIAEHLVKTQSPDGSMGGSVEETAFAVAFLCRGGITYEPSESENDAPADPADPADAADDATTEAGSENTEPAEQPAAP